MSAATLTDREASVVEQIERHVEQHEEAKVAFAAEVAKSPAHHVHWHWDSIVRSEERAGLAHDVLEAIRRDEEPLSVIEACRFAVKYMTQLMTDRFYVSNSTNPLANAEWAFRAEERARLIGEYRSFIYRLEEAAKSEPGGETVVVPVEVAAVSRHAVAGVLENAANTRLTPSGAVSRSDKGEHKYTELFRSELESVASQIRKGA